MSVDPYAPCPGGTGKKVKFCCPDLLNDLDKIQQLRNSDQRAASLELTERTEARCPGRACLAAIKADLLREMGRVEDAARAVANLLDQQGDNPVALAEQAMLALESTAPDFDPRTAIPLVHRALAADHQRSHAQVLQAAARLAEALFAQRNLPAAIAHLQLYLELHPDDEGALRLLSGIYASPSVHALMKEARFPPRCPQGVPWQAEYEAAEDRYDALDWVGAEQAFAALAQKIGTAPEPWWAAAAVRCGLGDLQGAADAFRQISTLEIPLDEAVDAEAMAQLFDLHSMDVVEFEGVLFTLKDPERAIELLESSTLTVRQPPPPSPKEGEPPAKAAYLILDRPRLNSAEGVTFEASPRILGRLLLYGRQTDREARVEGLPATPAQLPAYEQAVTELLGSTIEGTPQRHKIGRAPVVDMLLQADLVLPPGTSHDTAYEFMHRVRREAILDRLPEQPLACLGGLTLKAAAQDPAYRVRCLAAILRVELQAHANLFSVDFDELRTKLNLPLPSTLPVSDEAPPLAQLTRVPVAELSDEQLAAMFSSASMYRVLHAARKLGRELLSRPSVNGSPAVAALCRVMVTVEDDARRVLELIEQGRQASLQAQQSCAEWDLQEVYVRIERDEPQLVMQLIEHLVRQHGNEEAVRPAIARLLAELGLLRPDGGTLRQAQPATPAQSRKAILDAPAAPAESSSGIWTPGGSTSTGSAAAGGAKKSSLWIPGQE